jgi:hypothetical protein
MNAEIRSRKITRATMARLRSSEIVKALHRISQDLIAERITPLESRRKIRALGLPDIDALNARLDRKAKRAMEKIEQRIDNLAARFPGG